MTSPCVNKKRLILINVFRLKNNHDFVHISHDMTKDLKVSNELLQEAKQRNNDS